MAKYRKRPIVIEAEQWFHGKHVEGVIVQMFETENGTQTQLGSYVETLQGPVTVFNGDWIINGLNGEKYSCNPKIFEQVYEKVEG